MTRYTKFLAALAMALGFGLGSVQAGASGPQDGPGPGLPTISYAQVGDLLNQLGFVSLPTNDPDSGPTYFVVINRDGERLVFHFSPSPIGTVRIGLDLVRINNLATVPSNAFDDLNTLAEAWGDTPFFSVSNTQWLSLQMDCLPDGLLAGIDQLIQTANASRDLWSPEALGQNL
jgi:hypothetical protein